MPVERHPPRRSSVEDPSIRQREQELRRARGEIACVECQRLKLRCDRKVPCASCIRRNRAMMCPNGHAWSDQETRSLLSDTAQLHRKLSEMSQRIRQLEDALEISHSASSKTSHPLLREELLAIKRGVGPSPAVISEKEDDARDSTDSETVEEAMGTMTISNRGTSRFIGRSGGGETLFLLGSKDGPPVTVRPEIKSLFAQNLGRSNDSWLFMSVNASQDEILQTISENMPSFERGYSLAETYLENFSWILRVVQRDQLFNELLPCQYGRLGHSQKDASDDPNAGLMNAHELALLLAVFATGALSDLTLAPYNDEAEKYYQMALAALSVSKVLGSSSLAVVQALATLGVYNAHAGRNTTLDIAGSFLSLAAHMGVSMGLHRDCEKWKVKSSIVERRRFIFWEIFTADGWHNLAYGKPSSYALRYSDCKFPDDKDKRVLPNGVSEHSYWVFRHTFSKDLVYPISDIFSGVKPIKYHQILEFDRKITDYTLPSHLQIPPEGSSMETDGPLLIMQRMVPPICQNGLLMYIHRGFFAKALLDHPTDPLSSPYAHSYLSAYRAALSILKVVRDHYQAFPNLVSRFWSLWSHAFSATIIIGSIVIKGRNSETAAAALIELNYAVGLFEKAAQQSDRAKRSLPTLLRLREKAHYSARYLGDISTPCYIRKSKMLEGMDELLIFGGSTKFFDKDKYRKDQKHNESAPPLVKPLTTTAQTNTSPSTSRTQSISTEGSMFPSPLVQQPDLAHLLMGDSGAATNTGTPQTPEDMNGAGNASFPSTWSAWSDQEAMLINYLSSGVDMTAAHTAAFNNDPDPSSFMWAEMAQAGISSTGNSPPESGTQGEASAGSTTQPTTSPEQNQQQMPLPPSGQTGNGSSELNAFNLFSTNNLNTSSYAPPADMKAAFEAEFGSPSFQQNQPQQQQPNVPGWDVSQWASSVFY